MLPLGGQVDFDELTRAAANHPLVVLTLAIIIVLIVMKRFNQLK
jgi:cobalamin synthase